MAKKRGGSPLGNAPGSQEAQVSAAKANIDSLTRQLSQEITNAGESVVHYLQQTFGIQSVGNSVVWQLESGSLEVWKSVDI